MEFVAVIEIPKGTRNKYEIDHATGLVWLDRQLSTATQYPADYGFIEGTLAEDGDPLDVLVLLDEPTFPGCHIHSRAVALFRMEDENGADAKVLAVPATDARWAGLRDLDDVAAHRRDEIRHFFDVYKELEPGKSTTTVGWDGAAAAEAEITESMRRLAARPHPAGRAPGKVASSGSARHH